MLSTRGGGGGEVALAIGEQNSVGPGTDVRII